MEKDNLLPVLGTLYPWRRRIMYVTAGAFVISAGTFVVSAQLLSGQNGVLRSQPGLIQAGKGFWRRYYGDVLLW